MDWMKILGALGLIMMIVFIWPRAMYMMKNSPKATNSDWFTTLILLGGVAGFVALLMAMV